MSYIVCDPMHKTFEISHADTLEEAQEILHRWKSEGRKYASILIAVDKK